MRVYLIGFMGSGKTHWGRQLSEKLSLPFFDLDEQVESHAGKPIAEIFKDDGEEHFRLLEKEVLHIITESHESFIMACGGGSPCYFNNLDYMNKAGTTIWINTSIDVLYARLVKEKEKRPLIRDLSNEQLRSFIGKKYSDRRIYYEQADVHVEEEPVEIDKLIGAIFKS